ncbi:MAG: alpha/beta hydrolase [Chitinophagia bacterium]
MQNSIKLTPHYYNYGIDQLAYYDEGKGKQTLLLIHGFGEDHCIWENQIDFLSAHYRIIAPNLPGVHCKPLALHHSQAPSIQMYVEVLHELMHHLDIEQYYIIGHSMGGYIGLSFADYYVNHVQGLLLLHSTTYEDNEAKKTSRMKVAEFIQEWGVSKYLETATPNLFGDAFKKSNPAAIQYVMDSGLGISQEAMIQFVFAMRNRKAMTHLLHQNTIPVWMIAGDADLAVTIQDSLEQIKLLPSSNSLVLKEVGHMGMLEATEQVNQFIHQCIQYA